MGARGEHEPVVPQAPARLCNDVPFLGSDACHLVSMPAGIELGRDSSQLDAAYALRLERLLHTHRLVDELQLRRDDADVHPISRKRTQCQQSLKPGDPATDDEHPFTHGALHSSGRPGAVGASIGHACGGARRGQRR